MARIDNGVAPGDVNGTCTRAHAEAHVPSTGVSPKRRSRHTTPDDPSRAKHGRRRNRTKAKGKAMPKPCRVDNAKKAQNTSHASAGRTTTDMILPSDLRVMIEKSIADALAARFHPDPSFPPALSQLLSLGGSMQKRHGGILNEALAVGLEAGGNVTVLRDRVSCRVAMCPTAREIGRDLTHEQCGQLDLGYDRDPNAWPDNFYRTVDVDGIIYDHRDHSAVAFESKRGGKLGNPALQRMLETTSMVALLLRAHLKVHGQSASSGDAKVIVHHAARGLCVPDGVETTLAALDERYGGNSRAMVAAATALHARLVCEAMAVPLARAMDEMCGALGLEHGKIEALVASMMSAKHPST